MKLVSFVTEGRASYGVVQGEIIRDLAPTLGAEHPDLKAVIAAPTALDRLRQAASRAPELAFSAVTLLPTIPNPSKIFCIGVNYDEHRVETGRSKTEHPTVFTRFAESQVAHRQDVWIPRESMEVDFEGELAVVIGRGGRRIAREQALSHVAGYSCYNDVSIRDWQRHTSQFTPGKNFQRTGAFGPWLVTADEVPDPQAIELTTRVNGQVMQHAQTSQMIFQVADLIAYCSTFTMLVPGDVIVSGTPGGVGAKRTPPVFLKDGDIVEVEISSIGILHNRAVAEPV